MGNRDAGTIISAVFYASYIRLHLSADWSPLLLLFMGQRTIEDHAQALEMNSHRNQDWPFFLWTGLLLCCEGELAADPGLSRQPRWDRTMEKSLGGKVCFTSPYFTSTVPCRHLFPYIELFSLGQFFGVE